ncbi:50S ribosomal protein L13 [Candidatus Woesearchaeota archaeon]|nr:50S ribosomal protein L13 [Candidatus Woesearchaeota archaeon]
MIIDATNLILGRLASIAAKRTLLGEKVEIINCEKAVITGAKGRTLKDYKEKMLMGSSTKGPFTYRRSNMFVKRAIRGMLPYKKENGRKAFKRIRCHIGVPDSLKESKPEQLKGADISKLTTLKYVYVKDICRMMGEKQ